MHPCLFQALPDSRDLVGGQVVDDDDATRFHLRDQALFEPLAEDDAGHRTGQQLGSKYAVMGEARDKSGCHPVTMRCIGKKPLAFLAPAMTARHRRICAGFINKDQ